MPNTKSQRRLEMNWRYIFLMGGLILLCSCVLAQSIIRVEQMGQNLAEQIAMFPRFVQLVMGLCLVLLVTTVITQFVFRWAWWLVFVTVPLYTAWLGQFEVYWNVTLLGLIAPFAISLISQGGIGGLISASNETGRTGIARAMGVVSSTVGSLSGMISFLIIGLYRNSDAAFLAAILGLMFGVSGVKSVVSRIFRG